ncbi:MAG: DUF4124 domain-containing protein [Gammaproteobacteria bacterium]
MILRIKKLTTLAALTALTLGLASGQALAAGKVYKWVDENGVTHYGDSIPAKYSKQSHDVLNDRGMRVETVHATEPQQDEKPQPETSRDRALLATYGSVAEIEQVRDRRLGYLESQNAVAHDRLGALRTRLEELEADGGDENEVRAVRQRIGEYEAEIARREDDKAQISASFGDDIRRFRELKGLDAG